MNHLWSKPKGYMQSMLFLAYPKELGAQFPSKVLFDTASI